MRFIYSEHARQNMMERRITPAQVEEAILNPETEKVYIIVTLYYTKIGRY